MAVNSSLPITTLLYYLRDPEERERQPAPHCSTDEWELLLNIAAQAHLAPLLYHRLSAQTHPDPTIPHTVLEQLRGHYQANALRNFRGMRSLRLILKTFGEAGIQTMVLKGAYISQVVYRNQALRVMSDMDILVHQEDIALAEERLLSLGFVLTGDRQWFAENHHHFIYEHPSEGLCVELHWHIQLPESPFSISKARLWELAKAVNLGGMEAWALEHEDLLIHLCLQTSHQYLFDHMPLRALVDIDHLVRYAGQPVDWDICAGHAHEWGVQNVVYLTLRMAQKLLGTPVPEETLAVLQAPDFDLHYIEWSQERIFSHLSGKEEKKPSYIKSDGIGMYWRAGNRSDRLKVLLATLFPPPHSLRRMYQIPQKSNLLFAYYLFRPFHLVYRYAGQLVALARNDPGTLAWVENEGRRTTLEHWLVGDRDASKT